MLPHEPVIDDARFAKFCPRYHAAIELIGKRWSGAILRSLIRGPQRFNAIQAAIPGLSERLLSERLKEFCEANVIARTVEDGPPVRVCYELTEAGDDLRAVFIALANWSEKWIDESGVCEKSPAAVREPAPRRVRSVR
jgi:DNA-binding HxlR family transcriptional regulator